MRVSPRQLGVLSVLVASLVFAQTMLSLFPGLSVGGDFMPLRHAGQALIHGQSVYQDKLFVYPPSAAPVFVPFAFGTAHGAFTAYLVLSLLGLLLAAGLVAVRAPAPWRLPVFAAGVLALTTGTAAAGSLFLGNLSVLLVLMAVLILSAFHQERWLLGCALLMATLLVKPLLAPLLLVPVVRRRWFDLVRTAIPAIGLAGLAVLCVPGGNDLARILSYCLSGTNLHGYNAVNNLSLRGWAEYHRLPLPWATAASAALVVLVVARAAHITRSAGLATVSPVWLGNLALLTTLLVGHISEVHFLLIVVAGTLLHLVIERSLCNALLAAPGLVMLSLPSAYLALAVNVAHLNQNWLVTAELLLLAAMLLARHPVRTITPTPSSARARSVLVPA